MLRFEISEADRGTLPPIDVDAVAVIVGSGPGAQIRLPGNVAAAEHVRVVGGSRWQALAPIRIDGVAHAAGETGTLSARAKLELGAYTIVVFQAPPGVTPSGPLRTDSLARELVRGLLGDGGVPTLVIEQGPLIGTTRSLAPPISSLVIGRGDEAGWVILDEDLSRAHAEVRREWDGIRVLDRGSKNGTRVDGVPVGDGGTLVADGALVALGSVQLRVNDPAERHLRGELPLPQAAMRLRIPSIPPGNRASGKHPSIPATQGRSLVFWLALAVAGAAIGAAVWLLLG